jgi:hypothetical protein
MNMSLPFLDDKKFQVIPGITRDSDKSNDQVLLEKTGHELMQSIHRKDIRAIRDSLQAIVTMIKNEDKE